MVHFSCQKGVLRRQCKFDAEGGLEVSLAPGSLALGWRVEPGWGGGEGGRGVVGIALVEKKVSWFLGFLVSEFLGFLVSKIPKSLKVF